jgi:nucleotide-binding universal stress UspA family protein
VLVIPNGEPVANIGERVFVAWDGRRESTRAVFGALPLLRRASIVRLHRINQAHQDRHHFVEITEELANTLARHGVSVEVCYSDANSIEIAHELLEFAKDMDADVMVTGCFGHSPLREYLLGGTSRRLLENSTLPLLMSN